MRIAQTLSLCILYFAFTLSANANDNVSFVKQQLDRRGLSAYMSGDCEPASFEGWSGFPVKRCEYKHRNFPAKPLKVYMLNADTRKIAEWLVSACKSINSSHQLKCSERLAAHTICQSGAQFPVAGFVAEGNLIYLFRDGITVKFREIGASAISRVPTNFQEKIVFETGTISAVRSYARIAGTSQGGYERYKGVLLGDGFGWKKEIRKAYQKAWRSNTNELMNAWAKSNKAKIDRNVSVRVGMGRCRGVYRSWRDWPINGN